MITVVYSYKGGVGTSVVAASLALHSAEAKISTLMVDTLGDQPGILAVNSPLQGYGDWVNNNCSTGPPLHILAKKVIPYLDLLGRGTRYKFNRATATIALAALSHEFYYYNVIIDAGTQDPVWWGKQGDFDVMVVRSCYLNLRRIGSIPPNTKVVMVSEFGRALTRQDVEVSIGQNVSVVIPHTPAISRIVDAGLLPVRHHKDLRPLRKLLTTQRRNDGN